MSVQMMGAVISNGPRDRTEFVVMTALANYADDFGFAFPSIATIAIDSRCDERTTRRQLVELERRGWLYIARKVLNGKSNVYMLNLDRLGVMVPSMARRNPVFLRLCKRHPGTMTPIFAPEESADIRKFSEVNPQRLTGQIEKVTGQKGGTSADIACPPNRYEPSMEPSGTARRGRTNPPTPFAKGVQHDPDAQPVETVDISAAAEELPTSDPACGPEATEKWGRLKLALKHDLGNAFHLPQLGDSNFRPIRAGVSDFELCFDTWWLERVRQTPFEWDFVTRAHHEGAAEAGIAKYQGRLEKLIRAYFPVPPRAQIHIDVEWPPKLNFAPLPGRIDSISAVADDEEDSP